MLKWMGRIVVLALGAATVYEIVDALGFGSWRGLGFATTVGVIALLATVALAVVFAFARHVPSEAALLAPAAAAFLIAFFFSYDPYFGDAVRRYSDKGIPWWWVALVAAGAISVGILTRRSPRAGAALTALVPFVVWGTMVGLGND